MTLSEFVSTLKDEAPPAQLSNILTSLWFAAKHDWETAHNIAQDIPSKEGSWIHAYLHRVEGDQWNAEYWYRRAGKPVPLITLEDEWRSLVTEFLAIRD